jgi:hypothetical protein
MLKLSRKKYCRKNAFLIKSQPCKFLLMDFDESKSGALKIIVLLNLIGLEKLKIQR